MTMARLVAHLSRRANRAVEEAEGITLSQMTALGQLRALGGSARMVDLSDRLQLTKAAITKVVDGLEAGGWIERRRDPGDRRVIAAHLTGGGREVLGRAEQVFEAVMREGLWTALTPDETAEAARILAKASSRLGVPGGAVLPPS
jgi:DNA-binding MarR family transcriptional regulator